MFQSAALPICLEERWLHRARTSIANRQFFYHNPNENIVSKAIVQNVLESLFRSRERLQIATTSKCIENQVGITLKNFLGR